jgi:hypothetical protein
MPAARVKLVLPIVGVTLSLSLLGGLMGQAKPQGQEKWTPEKHDVSTNFPLSGRHRTTPCGECHIKGVFEGTPTACEACHWERRQDDRYETRLGFHCGECHTPEAWKNVSPAKWNHQDRTGFKLEGEHRFLECADCHGENNFQSGAVDCFGCHEEDFRKAKEPDHIAAGFPTQCRICHKSSLTWKGAVYAHTAFVLRGKHRLLACSECHADGRYAGRETACVSCHIDDYNGTKDPNHKQAGFPVDCERCHGTAADSWEGAKFNHAEYWPLKGAHKILDCNACHSKGYNLPKECYGCHVADYNSTTDPNHKASGFPTTCADCHLPSHTSWSQAKFDHSDFWALKGAHKTLDCNACHSKGYNLPKECYGCHAADYNSTTDPNHKTSGFPTTCENCHYPSHTSWSQAVFQHDFPIKTGRHAGLACTDCHTTSNYREFSCIHCHAHEKTKMAEEHKEVSGFSYNSQSCYACHPQGQAD